ncbi:MAG: S24 family peptidase [Planctomycetaceae bacterium]|jgi:repressor LexA
MTPSPKKQDVTKRQREIFEYLRDQIVDRGFGPTVREIGTHFGIRSPNGVMCHLRALEKKGLITRESNMSRAIKLCKDPPRAQSLGFLGTAVSGSPIRAAVSTDQQIDFNNLLNGENQSVLKVEGSGFSPLKIADGDFLIIRRNSQGDRDSLVVVLDDRSHVTICRISEDGADPVPAIPGAFKAPIRRILGVLAGVVRQLNLPPGIDHQVNGAAFSSDGD